MSITDQIISLLISKSTYSNLLSVAPLVTMLSGSSPSPICIPPPKPYIEAIEVSGSAKTYLISINIDHLTLPYQPRTALGKKLMAFRKQAIAKGLPLLNADEIIDEIRRRRGELT